MSQQAQRDLAELMDRLVTLLLAGYMTRQQTISLVNYMVEAGDALDVEAFVRELAYRVPQHEEELMTIAQRLEQKGIEKGIEKGIKQGIEKGIEQGVELGKRSERLAILKIVSTMRQNGMDDAAVMKMTGLTAEELAQLHQ